MAINVEGDVWKCRKHPSKRPRSGVCPACLRDRLLRLCPDCARVRPCSCSAAAAGSASSTASSSSPFSFFSSHPSSRSGGGGGGRPVSHQIGKEPALRRTRSTGIPYLFSRVVAGKEDVHRTDLPGNLRSKISWVLSKFKFNRNRKGAETENPKQGSKKNQPSNKLENYGSRRHENLTRMRMKSRSLHVPVMNSGDVRIPAMA